MTNNKFQQLKFNTNKDYSEDISNWLQLNGAISVAIVDAGDEPIYEPDPEQMPLWQDITISAIFKLNQNIHNLITKLNYDFSKSIIKNYNCSTIEQDISKLKYKFDPICFANRLWVYPYNQKPDLAHKDRCYFNLEPGLAFGSGEHPTTILCLEWLANNIKPDKNPTVVDYGSGSGVLSLASAKLGAGTVVAVDNDPQAILATTENARRNNIPDKISTFMPSETPMIEADYVVSNILANPLIELAPKLISLLKNSGTLVLSGILNEQTDMVALAYMNYGITITDISKKGAWVRIVGHK